MAKASATNKKVVPVSKAKVAVKATPAKAKSKPAAKAVAKPASNAPAKPVAKPAVKSAAKAVVKPASKAPAKPVAKPVVKPAAKAAPAPVSKPAAPAPVVAPPAKVAPKPVVSVKPVEAEVVAPPKPVVPQRMNPQDLAYFEQLLIEKRAMLVEQLQSIEEANLSRNGADQGGENSGYTNHLADAASDYATLETNLDLVERESKYLVNIEDALERVRRGSYGVCKLCGGLIEKPRLEAVPTATKHVDCKLHGKKQEDLEQQVERARQMARMSSRK